MNGLMFNQRFSANNELQGQAQIPEVNRTMTYRRRFRFALPDKRGLAEPAPTPPLALIL